ncbi:FtsX-like permease family protein [Solwaraspora sp. WMMD1047]|uniref:ABC transporter permease n=1 Tax=Solwaraspora sp. WMMD1047 TaxID=3016102 RepID=UPI0024172C95|nr:FtsX-like permease family protein [Solwaraspora sp. WMMD1047]MDG4827764.1 FtsX-like permease family protein [Solwaraspora sp. WMMD1047]
MIAKLALRSLRAHKLRLGLTAIAVILGVSFVSGTLIFRDTMSQSFDDLFSEAYAEVEIVVRAERSFSTDESVVRPVPESVLTTIDEKVPDANLVYGSLEGYAAVVGSDGEVIGATGTPQIGGAWVDDPTSGMKIVSGTQPRAPDEMVLDKVSADAGGLRPGDEVQVLTQGPTQTMRMTGTFEFTGRQSQLNGVMSYAAFLPEVAQTALVKEGHYSEILVFAKRGVPQDQVLRQVQAVLPAGFQATTGQEEIEEAKAQIKEFLDFVGIFLLVFAAVSIFVGSFIIFNTFAMLVAQRTRELALLRAIGASRSQVTRSVLGEALGIGIIGSTLGLAAGAGLALGLEELIGLIGVELPTTGLTLNGGTIFWSYLVGIVVTAVAAYFPARRASKIPPVAAIRDKVATPSARSGRMRLIGGGITIAFGVLVVLMGFGSASTSTEDATFLVGVGTGIVLLAIGLLGPVLSRHVTGAIGWPFARLAGTVGRLSRENARRSPRRTAATAAALMIGLTLVSLVSVLAASMKASVDAVFEREFGADYSLEATSFTGFSADALRAVENAPGVRSVTPVQYGAVEVDGERLLLMVADPAQLAGPIKLDVEDGAATLGSDELLVQRNVADSRGWRVGSTVTAEYPDGATASLRIAGIYAESQLVTRQYIMTPESYRPHAPTSLVNAAYVDTNDGVRVRSALESALAAYPNVNLQDRQEAKEKARADVDELLGIVIVLLLLSIIIAALGIVNTLALSVIERTREIGLLRAVGMSRRQLRRMVRYESVVIALYGAALGVLLGLLFGWANQRIMVEQGVEVLAIPYGQLALYTAAAALVGVIAAIWPARRAARMDILRAIATQ